MKFLKLKIISLCVVITAFSACSAPSDMSSAVSAQCSVFLAVLGTAQDAGKPQISVHSDPVWINPSKAELAVSLGLIDRKSQNRYIFDASPDIKQQLYRLDHMDDGRGFVLDGIFLTHGHMGHYLGLAQLGREAMGAKSIPVYAMPKMVKFLETNGPWDQLVALKNIDIRPVKAASPVYLSDSLTIMPFVVPHRGEYMETVGYRILTKDTSAIYLPDIDSWTAWEKGNNLLEKMVQDNDRLYLDATFFSGAELPGRDMSLIPHPTITTTMTTLAPLPEFERAKVHFIHLNHSNPAHDKTSAEYHEIIQKGFKVAQTGDTFCLDAPEDK
jgi:pyrroloquinoline quinone biosynthesis protein B